MPGKISIDGLITRISDHIDLLSTELILLQQVMPHNLSQAQIDELVCITEKLHQSCAIAGAMEHPVGAV